LVDTGTAEKYEVCEVNKEPEEGGEPPFNHVFQGKNRLRYATLSGGQRIREIMVGRRLKNPTTCPSIGSAKKGEAAKTAARCESLQETKEYTVGSSKT